MLSPTRLCSKCQWRFYDIPAHIPCPQCGTVDGVPPAQPPSHWLALHQYPIDHADDWRDPLARAWFATWELTIPSYNCACQANWQIYKADHPAQFVSAREFFEWSVLSHNYVSQHHAGKPTMTLAEAEEKFSAPWREN